MSILQDYYYRADNIQAIIKMNKDDSRELARKRELNPGYPSVKTTTRNRNRLERVNRIILYAPNETLQNNLRELRDVCLQRD